MHDVRSTSGRTARSHTSTDRATAVRRRTCAAVAVLALTFAGPSAQADPLRGRVTAPDGAAAAGVSVAITGISAAPLVLTTDKDGRFEADVPPGNVTIRAFAPSVDVSVSRAVDGETFVELQLQIRAVSETLTVTASPVDMPVSRAGPSVSVISRDEIAGRQLLTLGDALRLTPGFAVARTGGPGTVTSAFPRGGESDFTLVLVDGVRANAFGGGLDLSQVPIDDAARVEVVRGPQSALYGADAIGGVIQIVTSRTEGAAVDGHSELGGRGARNGAASARGGWRAWRAGVSLARQQEDGFTGRAPADGTTVTNDDSALTHASASVAARGRNGREWSLATQYVESDRGAPGPFGTNPVGNFGGLDRDARSVTRRRSLASHVALPWRGPASRARLRVDADVADLGSEFRAAFGSRGSTTRRHARVQLDGAARASLSGTLGLEGVDESARNTFITAGAVEVPVERRSGAVFAEGRWTPGSRGSLSVGLRAERFTRGALAAHPSAFSPRPAFAEETIGAVNPRASAVWVLASGPTADAPSTRLRASAGTGIRPPDAFEIAFTDNPSLAPERNVSGELGVVQTWARGTVHAEATVFHNRYDDLIVAVGRLAGTSRFRTDNIANAQARGLETALAWRPSARVALRGHYTWLDATVLGVDRGAGQAPPPFRVGDALLRRPRHQGAIDLAWQSTRAQLFATSTWRGRTLDVEPSFGASGGLFTNPAHAVMTVGGAWTLRAGVALYARVVNALDARYDDVLGYPALGRTAYAGVRVAARR